MDIERVNWCRLAQTIVLNGEKVLRKLLLREILTMTFANYSRFWMNKVHNPTENDYMTTLWNDLNGILKSSQSPSDKRINSLLKSWTTIRNNKMPVMEQIIRLKQWKNEIEKELEKSVSRSADDTLMSWLSQTEKEIQKMEAICTVLSHWNNTFQGHLQNAQSSLSLEIKTNERFMSVCGQKLKSLLKPTSRDFQQLVQNFKRELNIWKGKCCDVLQEFSKECLKSIQVWIGEAQGVSPAYTMVKFLNRFKTDIEDLNLQSQVDLFFDKWDDNLRNVFDRYERQMKESDSTEAILTLAQNLCTELEKFSSFKEKKIKDFFCGFNPPEFPRLLHQQLYKLKDISRSSDLKRLNFTILMVLWENGKFVHSPLQDRHKDPYKWDTTLSADILRLREHRNNIVAHIAEFRIDSQSFETLWKQLTMLLRNIASRCGDKFNVEISREIDHLKDQHYEAHTMYNLRKWCLTWCKNDILAQLSAGSAAGRKCLDMLQSIQTALENLSKYKEVCMCHSCNQTYYMRNLSEERSINQGNSADSRPHILRNESAHNCRICFQRCDSEKDLAQHMLYHQDIRCCICNTRYRTETDTDSHIMSHRVLTCRSCSTDFHREDALQEHMISHQALTCRICNKDFAQNNELVEHMRSHQARTCRGCIKDFPTGNELDKHMADHQARTCHSCKYECSTSSELAEHARNRSDCPKGTIGFLNCVFRN